jgi:hypothetical protein
MTTDYRRHEAEDGLPSEELFRSKAEGGSSAWKRWMALGGIGGAAVAGALGALALLAGHLLGGGAPAATATLVGNVLLFAVIPLVMLGATALDWLEDDLRARERGAAPSTSGSGLVRRAGAAMIAATFLSAAAAPARAQQTIHNVPTTDVLPRGKVYFELDSTWKPVEPRFSSFVPRVVVGTGGNVEVGLNVTGNVQPGDDVTALQPTFKWKVYDGEKNGWAVVVGDNITIPVRNEPFDVGNYVYAEASKSFATSTRVTFGGYHFSESVVVPDAQRAGGQFGFEQTVTPWLNVNADWITGKHASGYFTPGVSFKPHPKVTGYAGYSIGNTGAGRGNHFVYTAVGLNLN